MTCRRGSEAARREPRSNGFPRPTIARTEPPPLPVAPAPIQSLSARRWPLAPHGRRRDDLEEISGGIKKVEAAVIAPVHRFADGDGSGGEDSAGGVGVLLFDLKSVVGPAKT